MSAPRIRVLLADDHPAVRAGIRQFLERDPAIEVVAEAGNGEEALALIARHRPDIVLLDLRMPGLSGLEVLRRLRTEHPEVRALVLTAYDDDPYVFAALRAGARGYLLKTTSPDDLIRGVRMVYAGRSVLDPGVAERLVEEWGRPEAGGSPERLTERELEVLRLAARGLTNRAIGFQLGISERTVHSHLMNIFAKLGVNTRTEAVLKAIRLGWISLEDAAE
ncbi:Transcriptional regulatory protein DegU [Candidatus Thermoflexus japonica]|uniref:Transcriptional regulatory protein DegU n=1 Tax=Candidatus Thermoflexus japonica TaxID=2035417 RepID=A0A2H5Y331_9CHLR|nr:Transcriptional regulatory protein DegU [Candidatus Thermoflexus japonica]